MFGFFVKDIHFLLQEIFQPDGDKHEQQRCGPTCALT